MVNINEVRLLSLPKILDERGNLSFMQNQDQVPFDIERVYWIYDVPGGEKRGGHAYKELKEVIVALSGSFDLVVDDGYAQKTISLNRSYNAVYLPNGVWRQLENFSTNALCLVMASAAYDEHDYIRDYQQYKNINR